MARARARGDVSPRAKRKLFGDRLRQAREKRGLSQTQVAAAVLPPPKEGEAVRYQTVSEWERGERELTVTELAALRELLGFGWLWFFEGTEDADALRLRVIGQIASREIDDPMIEALDRPESREMLLDDVHRVMMALRIEDSRKAGQP